MTTKHTPGPWRVTSGGIDAMINEGAQTVGRDIMAGPVANPICVAADVREEDARLISAAPDLLKALKRYLSHVHERKPGDRTLSCPCEMCEAARAAMAKAVGK